MAMNPSKEGKVCAACGHLTDLVCVHCSTVMEAVGSGWRCPACKTIVSEEVTKQIIRHYFTKHDVLTIQVQVVNVWETTALLESLYGGKHLAGCKVASIHRRDLPATLQEVERKLEAAMRLIRGEVLDVTWRLLERNRQSPPPPDDKIHTCAGCGGSKLEVLERGGVWSVRCLNDECKMICTPYRDRSKE